MSIDRWDLDCPCCNSFQELSPRGRWVKYDDHFAEVKRLEVELETERQRNEAKRVEQELLGRVIIPDEPRKTDSYPLPPIVARPGSELVRAELRDILDADNTDLEWAAWVIARELERRKS